MVTEISIDGALGEGGGQVLRSALALSMITGIPFHIRHIRAGRPRPGLMRQHCTAVLAAAEICDAEVSEVRPSVGELRFRPGTVRPGSYRWDIGTAGSCGLVLQTVLPALVTAPAASRLIITGGTHNRHAPPFEFLRDAFLPLLERMGAQVTVRAPQYGFEPAGGGMLCADVRPVARLRPLHLEERGPLNRAEAVVLLHHLERTIAEREVRTLIERLWKARGWPVENIRIEERDNSVSAGNMVFVTLRGAGITEVFSGFGRVNQSAEGVAREAAAEVEAYLKSSAPVGRHLADQLPLYMALAGEGRFLTGRPTRHAATQMDLINLFLDLPARFEPCGPTVWRCVVGKEA